MSRRLFRIVFIAVTAALAWFADGVAAGPYSALVMEIESDRVLYDQNADEIRHPASLTKMMTLYMVFDAIERGNVSLQDTFYASSYSASRSPSRIGLRPGDPLTVEQGILALVTCSANDAAATLGEGLAGSEPAFAAAMTRKARELGMSQTVFRNASGLPDPDQVTTARDMYRLGKALLKRFPQYYPYFSTAHFQYRGRSFHNHNHLLENYYGADGIKTGFVNASGFNLVASARRNGVRLVGVVFGGNSAFRRDAHMRDILDDGFAQIEGREPSVQFAGFDRGWSPRLLARPGENYVASRGAKKKRAAAKVASERRITHRVLSRGPHHATKPASTKGKSVKAKSSATRAKTSKTSVVAKR
ncbi:MAG: D-alanyl-D-alanine carboxypeptidase [Methylococcus sp.]|nr:D-alanyl-D-alanine carboxypeptidase [Methylococcus sp.]